MSKLTKISGECFRHLVKSIPPRNKSVLKAKGDHLGTSNLYLMNCLYCVHCVDLICEGVEIREGQIKNQSRWEYHTDTTFYARNWMLSDHSAHRQQPIWITGTERALVAAKWGLNKEYFGLKKSNNKQNWAHF